MGNEKTTEEIRLETAKIQRQTARMKRQAQTAEMIAYSVVAGAILLDIASRKK